MKLIAYSAADPAGPLEAAAAPARALQMAYDQADLTGRPPELVTSPPASARQITGIKTWFWIDGWAPNQSPPGRAGGYTATVSVQPDQLMINPGDSSGTFTCDKGTAIAWTETASDTECGYSYYRRSTDPAAPGARGGTYPVTARLSYSARWAITEDATGEVIDGGDLPAVVSQASTLNLTVHSIEAVIR